jgi:hypothetical protein
VRRRLVCGHRSRLHVRRRRDWNARGAVTRDGGFHARARRPERQRRDAPWDGCFRPRAGAAGVPVDAPSPRHITGRVLRDTRSRGRRERRPYPGGVPARGSTCGTPPAARRDADLRVGCQPSLTSMRLGRAASAWIGSGVGSGGGSRSSGCRDARCSSEARHDRARAARCSLVAPASISGQVGRFRSCSRWT